MRESWLRAVGFALATAVPAAAQAHPISSTTNGPVLSATRPAELPVVSGNTVLRFALTGQHLRGTRPARLYIRQPGGIWQEVYAEPTGDSGFAVQVVSVPFFSQPGRIEFKAIVDGVDSNIFAVRVQP